MQLLFSYGTLMQEEVQLDLFGSRLVGYPDVLEGYKLIETEVSDEKFLATGASGQQKSLLKTGEISDKVHGVALEITDKQLELADQYEPRGYERQQVVLQSGQTAWAYFCNFN